MSQPKVTKEQIEDILIQELADVDVTTVNNSEVLQFNTGLGKWTNGILPDPGTDISQLGSSIFNGSTTGTINLSANGLYAVTVRFDIGTALTPNLVDYTYLLYKHSSLPASQFPAYGRLLVFIEIIPGSPAANFELEGTALRAVSRVGVEGTGNAPIRRVYQIG